MSSLATERLMSSKHRIGLPGDGRVYVTASQPRSAGPWRGVGVAGARSGSQGEQGNALPVKLRPHPALRWGGGDAVCRTAAIWFGRWREEGYRAEIEEGVFWAFFSFLMPAYSGRARVTEVGKQG